MGQKEFLNREEKKLRRARILARRGQLPPNTFSVHINHNSWCNFINERGPCNCNPTIDRPKRLINPEDS